MSRGLSQRQRQALALLVAHKRSLDVTAELLPMLGDRATDSTRRSLLRALRLLDERGLVTLERVPSQRGGWPRLLAAARPGADGELIGGDLQRARASVPSRVAGNVGHDDGLRAVGQPWTVAGATSTVRSALSAEVEDIWYHVKSHRMPYTATHHAGLIKTNVIPTITDEALLEPAAAVLRKLPGVLEVVVFPGDERRRLRPLAYVYWSDGTPIFSKGRMPRPLSSKGTQKPGGKARRSKSPARYQVTRGLRGAWFVIDGAKSQNIGFAIVTTNVATFKTEAAARRKADRLNAREH